MEYNIPRGTTAVQGIPIGRLANLEARVSSLETSGGGGTWYQDEVVASGVTGTSFSLINTPTKIVFLYLNGQYLVSGVGKDYTRSGKNITLATTLLSTDLLTANYS